MPNTSCKLTQITQLLEELKFEVKLPMTMYCNNQATIHIASNPMFHKCTKHIELDCRLVHEQVERGVITTPYVSTGT